MTPPPDERSARAPSRGWRLGGWVACLALLLGVIAHARFTTDLSVFLPRAPDGAERLLAEQLRDGVAARTLLVGIEGGDDLARAEALKALAAGMRASGDFEQVLDGEPPGTQAVADWVVAHRYVLSAGITADRFTAEGLRDSLLDTAVHAGGLGAALPPGLLARDSTGETLRIVQDAAPAQAPRMAHGTWVSRDHPRAVLLATLRAPGADLAAQAAALAGVERAFAPAAARGLRLLESGSPVFARASRMRIEHEALWLGGLGLSAVGLLLLATFASPWALLASMLPVATGVVAGLAATALVFGQVHGLTVAFGTALIGESVDYAIYYLVQAREGGWRRWVRESWPTVRLGLATSVCGFAVLVASGFSGLAQLGVFSVAGLVGAALATRWVLPALLPQGAPGRGLRRRLARVATRLLVVAPRARGVLLAAGLAGAVLAVATHDRLWRGDLASLSPILRDEQGLDASLRIDVGAADARTLVVAQGGDREAASKAAEATGQVLDGLVDAGTLLGYDTPARFWPSAETQRRRLLALPDAATLRARLAEATAGTPLEIARLEPFIRDVQAARAAGPMTTADMTQGPASATLDGLLFQRDGGGYAALLPLRTGPAGVDAAVVRAALARAGVDDVAVVDLKASLTTLYTRYLHEALLQSMLGALAVIALVAWRLRSARRTLAVLLPLALAVAIVLGVSALAGTTLGILHLVGMLLVVAIGSNYGLFFDHWQGGPLDADAPASLVLANLTAVIAFGLLACSSLPVLSSIGRVVAPGVLLALVGSAAFARLGGRSPGA